MAEDNEFHRLMSGLTKHLWVALDSCVKVAFALCLWLRLCMAHSCCIFRLIRDDKEKKKSEKEIQLDASAKEMDDKYK